MANGVTSYGADRISVEQTLHGYDGGHKLLSSSISVRGPSAKTLLIMSDVSGPNLGANQNGYITGYPLAESNFYAIGRTWPAPEKPRPGCVWTHTLLIHFSDLGAIRDPQGLLSLFSRPNSPTDHASYRASLTLPVNDVGKPPDPPLETLQYIINALYCSPNERIFVIPSDIFDADWWVLAVWTQQWPRLRRSFRFCTLSLNDRSTPEAPFDLQVLPGRDKAYRLSSAPKGLMVDSGNPAPDNLAFWISAVAKDLAKTGETNLRQFLWRFAADMEGGRAIFSTLAGTWAALEAVRDAPDYDKAILAVEGSAQAAPSLVQYLSNLIARGFSESWPPSSLAIRFLVQNFNAITHPLGDIEANRLARAIRLHGRDLISLVYSLSSPGLDSVKTALAQLLSPYEVFETAGSDPGLLVRMVAVNPLLAGNPEVWRAESPIPEMVFQEVKQHAKVGREVTTAMLEAGASDFAMEALKAFGRTAMDALLSKLDGDENIQGRLDQWIFSATKMQGLLLDAIGSGTVLRMATLASIANKIDYRHPSIDVRQDSWVAAIRKIDRDPLEGGLPFCAFLLARGLSRVSPQAGVLIGLSFDAIYKAAAASALDDYCWNLVRSELPSVFWWYEWDKCLRLRTAVARVFVEERLPTAEFLNVTKDDHLFLSVVEAALDQKNGENYLRFVLKETSTLGSCVPELRINVLRDVLKD